MFYDVYLELCGKIGKKPSVVAAELGINKSNVSNWKSNGYTPRGDTLNRIADYFGVTTDYLLGSEAEKAPSENGGGGVPHAKYREVLAGSGIRILLDADAKVSESQIEDIVDFIKFQQQKYGR